MQSPESENPCTLNLMSLPGTFKVLTGHLAPLALSDYGNNILKALAYFIAPLLILLLHC